MIDTFERHGYEFNNPIRPKEHSVVKQVYYVIKQMREDAYFLSMHGMNIQDRQENEIVESTLRSVLNVIKSKSSEKLNR